MDSSSVPVGRPWRSLAPDQPATELHVNRPHSARIYDYYLGGKDNFPADREAAEQVLASGADPRTGARQNRAFLHRVVRHLAGEAGIRQFLDIGTGIPTSPNLHEVAQGVAPETRVVYVDNDPIVLTHARALLTSTPGGRTAYLDADLREPARILTAPEVTETLDFTRPVALSLLAVLHFVPDDAGAYTIVRELVDALPSGSFVSITNVTGDLHPSMKAFADRYKANGIPLQLRTREGVARFFDGLDLLQPGVQPVHRWRPDGSLPPEIDDAATSAYGGVAYKA